MFDTRLKELKDLFRLRTPFEQCYPFFSSMGIIHPLLKVFDNVFPMFILEGRNVETHTKDIGILRGDEIISKDNILQFSVIQTKVHKPRFLSSCSERRTLTRTPTIVARSLKVVSGS
jgi:hypothetical protein